MKTFIEVLASELENESIGTRKMLALVPVEKGDWKPHAKNMAMKHLATHVAETAGWIESVLTTEGIDFATMPYEPRSFETNGELLTFFDENVAKSKAQLLQTKDDALDGTWTMRNGDVIFMQLSKYDTIRHSIGQMIHHRAQLGVYLRLLDIPIPGVYGPSADEMGA
ncbi:MAG: DinB family protein [Bacteroidetes bacterium]|nr:DinB family protein [Bacteroidota bacterium]